MKRIITLLTTACIWMSITVFAQGHGPWSVGYPLNNSNIVATFSDGTLTLAGSGRMYGFDNDETLYLMVRAPWAHLREHITSLVIDERITEIGSHSFYNLINLTGSLPLHEGITYIGIDAFLNCRGLTGPLTIPTSVTTIRTGAFWNCSGLTGDLIIPEGITEIEPYAFAGCSGLNGSLTIPEGVTKIGHYAFSGCRGLTGSLIIPQGVTEIGRYAFSSCSGLTGSLSIPQGVTTIGTYAFSNCSGFSGSLVIPQGVTVIDSYAFFYCSGLSGSLTIPQSLASIGNGAFRNCTGITSVNNYAIFPQGINSNVFLGLTLSNVTLHVPASSLASYQDAPVWQDFNILGLYCKIKAIANNEEYGTVSEVNDDTWYELGDNASLTAAPAEGYEFVNWTEDGVVVSAENPYNFTVMGDVEFVANFQSAATSLNEVSTDNAAIIGYYSIVGIKLPQAPQSGAYIIVYDNGKKEKRMRVKN